MILKKLDLNVHDTEKVSELIYFTDSHTFDKILNDKTKATEKLEKLVIAGNNSIGHENIYVVTQKNDDNVLGILVTSKKDQYNTKNEIKNFLKVFSISDTIRFSILGFIDMIFLATLDEEDFYLACVAVDEKARGQGIGTFILESSPELARNDGKKKLVLDVDLSNNGARRLYERFGFNIFNKKSIPWLGGERGMYNMEFLI